MANPNMRVRFVTMTDANGRRFILLARTLLTEAGHRTQGTPTDIQLENGSSITFQSIDQEVVCDDR